MKSTAQRRSGRWRAILDEGQVVVEERVDVDGDAGQRAERHDTAGVEPLDGRTIRLTDLGAHRTVVRMDAPDLQITPALIFDQLGGDIVLARRRQPHLDYEWQWVFIRLE